MRLFQAWFLCLNLLPSALLLSLPLAAVGAADSRGSSGWRLVFEDNFEREAIGLDWVIMRGDWRLEGGCLKITRAWSSDSAIRTAIAFQENVRAEFDVRLPGPYFVKAAVRIGDQFWDGGGRMRAGRGVKGGRNLGEVVLSPAGNKDPIGDAVIEPNRWHRVVIEYEDGRHRAWLNGQQVKDEEVALAGRYNDYFALFAIRDAEFDNVRILVKPHAPDFYGRPVTAAESNRRATVRAEKFLDPDKPDCGFQEAIDALPAAGGAVILPRGKFILHTTLFLREGVALRGQVDNQGSPVTTLSLPRPIVWSKLAAEAKAGESALHLEDASGFRPGWSLSLGVEPMYYLRAEEPGGSAALKVTSCT